MDSHDEVQEIDPPVIIQSGRKKYRQRSLTLVFVVVAKETEKMQKTLSLQKHHIMQL
jgi:hypothetical protein